MNIFIHSSSQVVLDVNSCWKWFIAYLQECNQSQQVSKLAPWDLNIVNSALKVVIPNEIYQTPLTVKEVTCCDTCQYDPGRTILEVYNELGLERIIAYTKFSDNFVCSVYYPENACKDSINMKLVRSNSCVCLHNSYAMVWFANHRLLHISIPASVAYRLCWSVALSSNRGNCNGGNTADCD